MLTYERSYEIAAPVETVAGFHGRAEGLKAITPPLLPMRFLGDVPEELGPGDEITFRTWVGPVRVRWHARIEALENVSEGTLGFQDRLLEGPFDHWLHQHRFVPLPGGGTRAEDHVEARLRRHPLWGPVGLQMWIGLPVLFAYRQAKTRRLLEVGEAG